MADFEEELRQARELFIKYHGSLRLMFEDCKTSEYESYKIPKELEHQWLEEEQISLLTQEKESTYFQEKSVNFIGLFNAYPLNANNLKLFLNEIALKNDNKINHMERFMLLNALLSLSDQHGANYREQDLFSLYETILGKFDAEGFFLHQKPNHYQVKSTQDACNLVEYWKSKLKETTKKTYTWQYHYIEQMALLSKHIKQYPPAKKHDSYVQECFEEEQFKILTQMKKLDKFLVSGVGLIDLFLIYPNSDLIDEYFQILGKQKTFDHDVLVHLLENLKKLQKIRLSKKQRKILDGIYEYLYALSMD